MFSKSLLLLFFLLFTVSHDIFSQITPEQLANEAKELDKQIETIKRYKKFPEVYGVYFTVKVDESENIISPENFKELNEDIYYDKIENGKWGYFIGTFKYYESASAFRRDLLERGFEDAVIAAYNNGQKIPIDKAIALVEKTFNEENIAEIKIADKDSVTETTAPKIKLSDKQSSTSTVIKNEKINKTETKKQNTQPSAPPTKKETDELEYRIQIAASKTEIPNTSPVFKPFKNVYHEKNDDGYTRYYVGSYATFESAITARKKIMESGAKEALVVAFYKYKKISLSEAQKLSIEKK